MNETKRYTVSILGESYTLLSDESNAHITQAANTIDKMLREILEKTTIDDPKRAAVLAAFRVTSKMIRMQADSAVQKEDCHKLVDLIERHTETI